MITYKLEMNPETHQRKRWKSMLYITNNIFYLSGQSSKKSDNVNQHGEPRQFLRRKKQHHPHNTPSTKPAKSVRVAKASGLEHIRTVPKESSPTTSLGTVQWSPRSGIPPVSRPIWQDQSTHHGMSVLRPTKPSRALSMPTSSGVGQSGCTYRSASGGVRGEWGTSGDQSVRS